jgi:hypothetical protein
MVLETFHTCLNVQCSRLLKYFSQYCSGEIVWFCLVSTQIPHRHVAVEVVTCGGLDFLVIRLVPIEH